MRGRFGLFSLLFALSLGAQTPSYTISPDRGSVAGGEQVTIRGEFGAWPYGVIFGSTHVPATRVNETTLVAVTPPHLPGRYPVSIFEYDFGISTTLTFEFVGNADDVFDRFLLPVFTWPVRGAFGSEFRTDLIAHLAEGTRADIYGLSHRCMVTCIVPEDSAYTLTPHHPSVYSDDLELTGRPGRFVYVPKDQAGNVAMNLRAYDTSRSAENFGTEIPIVSAGEFTRSCRDTMVLLGVPSDPGFRSTLRVYGHGSAAATADVRVTIEAAFVSIDRVLDLHGRGSLFEPYYAQFSDFPVGVGPMRVRLSHTLCPTISPQASFWGFVSVTNNATQHITLITPQP